MLAKQVEQFVANDLDHLLVRRKLQHHFGAQRLAADVGQQLVGNGDGDVALQQRFADFHQRRVQVFIGELALPTQILECSLQPFCQVFKHGLSWLLAIPLLLYRQPRPGAARLVIT